MGGPSAPSEGRRSRSGRGARGKGKGSDKPKPPPKKREAKQPPKPRKPTPKQRAVVQTYFDSLVDQIQSAGAANMTDAVSSYLYRQTHAVNPRPGSTGLTAAEAVLWAQRGRQCPICLAHDASGKKGAMAAHTRARLI